MSKHTVHRYDESDSENGHRCGNNRLRILKTGEVLCCSKYWRNVTCKACLKLKGKRK